MLAAADLALYFAKSTGASRYRFYEPSMLEEFQRRRAIESRIREGVENELFTLHYQPLVDARSRALVD